MANTAPRPCLFTHSHSHTHIHSLSLVHVIMMNSKELKTKIYSHAHSPILSLSAVSLVKDVALYLSSVLITSSGALPQDISLPYGKQAVRLEGFAYSGAGRVVERVEVSLDEGSTLTLCHSHCASHTVPLSHCASLTLCHSHTVPLSHCASLTVPLSLCLLCLAYCASHCGRRC